MLVCLITPITRGGPEALRKEVFQGRNSKGQVFLFPMMLSVQSPNLSQVTMSTINKGLEFIKPTDLHLGPPILPRDSLGPNYFPPWNPQWNLSQVTFYILHSPFPITTQSPGSTGWRYVLPLCPTSMSCVTMSSHSQSWSQAELALSAIIPLPTLDDACHSCLESRPALDQTN